MDERAKQRRAGLVVGVIGAAMLLFWLLLRAGTVSWPMSESARLFLPIVGAPLALAGILLHRGIGAPRGS